MVLPICRVSNTHGENVYTKTLTYFQMKKSRRLNLSNGKLPSMMVCSWISKIGCYENPYIVTGDKAKAEHRLRGST